MNTHPEQWAAMLQRPGSSWGFGALLKDTSVVVLKEDTPPPTIPAGPEIRTHNLPLTSPTRYPLGPRHASLRHHATQSDVPSRIARINIVCLHYDAIYSFGCFIFTFMKPSSAVIICTCIQTMAVWSSFICRQTVDQCREWILSQNAAKSPTWQ